MFSEHFWTEKSCAVSLEIYMDTKRFTPLLSGQNYSSLISTVEIVKAKGWRFFPCFISLDQIEHTYPILCCTQLSRAFWDCEGFLVIPAIIVITPGATLFFIIQLSYMQRFGRSHTQTLKSHDNIWCKSVILIFYYTFATCFYSKERKSYFMVSLIEVVKK